MLLIPAAALARQLAGLHYGVRTLSHLALPGPLLSAARRPQVRGTLLRGLAWKANCLGRQSLSDGVHKAFRDQAASPSEAFGQALEQA